MRNNLPKAVISFLLLLTLACSPKARPPVCSQKVFQRLYFGTATPTGIVTEPEWQEFLRSEVTPKFPAGFSVISADGQWLGADKKIVRERSHIIEIVRDNTTSEEAAIGEIIESYKSKFQQEAVMALTSNTVACF